jgi:osmotically-inducible protein OsmY
MKVKRKARMIGPIMVLGLSAAPFAFAQISTSQASQLAQAPIATTESVRSTADDATTNSAVATAIENDKQVRYQDIQVATEMGVVTLTGAVESPKQYRHAENLARHVLGVRAVNNHLTVITLSRADSPPR